MIMTRTFDQHLNVFRHQCNVTLLFVSRIYKTPFFFTKQNCRVNTSFILTNLIQIKQDCHRFYVFAFRSGFFYDINIYTSFILYPLGRRVLNSDRGKTT